MAQVKIYGLKAHLNSVKTGLSDVIHACVVEALQLPPEKRFHRFFPMETGDFVFSNDKSVRYTIVEIYLMEGRSMEAKKRLIHLLFERIESELGLANSDLEIQILESPKGNWGFRGQIGDEISLDYKVEV